MDKRQMIALVGFGIDGTEWEHVLKLLSIDLSAIEVMKSPFEIFNRRIVFQSDVDIDGIDQKQHKLVKDQEFIGRIDSTVCHKS